MFVIPKKGQKIPDPSLSDYLPEAGREVEENPYWLRRLRDGDVTKNSPKPQTKTVKEDSK